MTQFHELMVSEEQLKPSRNKRSRVRAVVLFVSAVVALAVIVGVVGIVRDLMSNPSFTGEGTGSVQVTVEKGDTLSEIGQRLADAGVVKSSESFVSAAEAEERSSSIGPGRYTLRLGMSGEAAVALMLDPISRADSRLVLPEGLRLDQTVTRSSRATGLPESDFNDVLRTPQVLDLPPYAKGRPEGFMFPATYDLEPEESAEQVLTMLVRRFNQASADVGLEERSPQIGYTPYEVLTVASLVQAESAPDDHAKVARVVYNRLAKDMPLQFDSTVNYALGTKEIQLSAEQLNVDSPYNTYRNKGLPPTPINSPGEAAMEAALSPARGDWLYFVTVDPETLETKFTDSYQKFLKFKAELRKNLARIEAEKSASPSPSESG
jgi:UPF0755 protein